MTIESQAEDESRAILIGVSAYEDAEFPPIRAARNSLTAMHRMLTDPELCGWKPETIMVISNPSSASDLAVQITNLARAAKGVLMIYYVGHGALSKHGELCLTVSTTLSDHAKITGLPWSVVGDALHESPARMRCAILDCCFAGQAIEAMANKSDQAIADITHVEGVYTLTATTRNRTAHVPPTNEQGTANTSFTGEFIDLITSGIPEGPANLTLDVIYPHLRTRLAERGLPLPNQRNTDLANKFTFAKNIAARVGTAGNAILRTAGVNISKTKSGTSAEITDQETLGAETFSGIANDDSIDITGRLEAAERLAQLNGSLAAEALKGIADNDSIDITGRLEAAGRLAQLNVNLAAEALKGIAEDVSIDITGCLEAAGRLAQLNVNLAAEALRGIAIREQNTIIKVHWAPLRRRISSFWRRDRRVILGVAVPLVAVGLIVLIFFLIL
jgi:hypothetical protein